jgi:hypothetical protein
MIQMLIVVTALVAGACLGFRFHGLISMIDAAGGKEW